MSSIADNVDTVFWSCDFCHSVVWWTFKNISEKNTTFICNKMGDVGSSYT